MYDNGTCAQSSGPGIWVRSRSLPSGSSGSGMPGSPAGAPCRGACSHSNLAQPDMNRLDLNKVSSASDLGAAAAAAL